MLPRRFTAEFVGGFGVMVLDISIGAIFAVVIPDTMRSRVSGAFQAINFGTRPVGALLGGLLGSVLGLRPALWIAVGGGISHVKPGDLVELGSALVEVESEKTSLTVEAERSGQITEVLVEQDQIVSVGTVVVRLADS